MSAATQQETPTRSKPIWKRWWVWVLVALAIIIAIVASQGGGDSAVQDDNASSSAPAEQPQPNAEQPAPAPEPAAPAPADNPLSDGDWTAADIQLDRSQFGDAITARVTNDADQARSGLFTLTIFGADGTRIGQTSGSANDVAPGATATVTFIGSTTPYPGDPSTYRYEFQEDGSF